MTIYAYSPAIHNAIARGDAARLRRLIAYAKKLHRQQGDLPKAIRAGQAALRKMKAKRRKSR